MFRITYYLKFLINSLKIYYCVARKNALFEYISKQSVLTEPEKQYLKFAFKPLLNRYSIGYIYFYNKKNVSVETKILTALIFGFVYAVDNIIDEKGLQLDEDIKKVYKKLLACNIESKSNESLLIKNNKITLGDYYELINSKLDDDEVKRFETFLTDQLKIEVQFRNSWKGWRLKNYDIYSTVSKYRNDSTIRYVEFLFNISNFRESNMDNIRAGTIVIQLLDDYMDRKEDYKHDEPNLFLAHILENGIELRSFFEDEKKYKKILISYKKTIDEKINTNHNIFARLFMYRFKWMIFWGILKW